MTAGARPHFHEESTRLENRENALHAGLSVTVDGAFEWIAALAQQGDP